MKNLLGPKFVLYKGMYLQKGSVAWELWHDPKDSSHAKLDKHLKEVDNLHRELLRKLP